MLLHLLLACSRGPCEVAAWTDADGDGHGDPGAPQCKADETTAADALDCDDTDPDIAPGAPESCDGVDQDCNGWLDDHPEPPLYADLDGDGYGGEPLPNCDAFGVDDSGDCDDTDPFLNPETQWFGDGDGDGAGATEVGVGCEPPEPGASRTGGDCDDTDPTRSPLVRERCGGLDLDCDPSNDATGAWMLPNAVGRVLMTAEGAWDVPLVLDIDPAWGLDGSEVRVVVQDCVAPVELPSSVVRGEAGLWAAGVQDEGASLVSLWDEDGDLTTVEPWPSGPVELGLYWGGADGLPLPTDVVGAETSLEAGGLRATFDPDRGGLISELLYTSGNLAGAAQATAGNGLQTSQGGLSVSDFVGSVGSSDGDGVTAGVQTEVVAQNGGGSFTYTTRWRMFAGRSVLLGRVSMVAATEVQIQGVDDRTEPIRPLQLRSPVPATCTTDPALQWGDLSTDEAGVTWAWVASPRWTNFASCIRDEVWTSANDLPNGEPERGAAGTAPAGQAIVDGGVLVLLAHGPGGPSADEERREAWQSGVTVTGLAPGE